MKRPEHILITGASSGLGKALAEEYASTGARLSLWGRDPERLAETAGACQRFGAEVHTSIQDVRDLEACRALLDRIDREQPLTLAFLDAGVITGVSPEGTLESVDDACRTVQVNLLGPVNMGTWLLERMAWRGAGHIVFISSIAGMYALPNSPAYSASKIGVSSFAGSLQALGNSRGVRVSRVYPGYLDTPMGRRLLARKPFLLTAGEMARHTRRSLEKGRDKIIHPWADSAGVRLLGWLPKPLADKLAIRFGYTVVPDRESTQG